MACILELISCQSAINDQGVTSEQFHSKAMYTITLSVDPTRMQVNTMFWIRQCKVADSFVSTFKVIADPRFSNEYYPIYELVYVSGQPTSQIRRISQLMGKLQMPEVIFAIREKTCVSLVAKCVSVKCGHVFRYGNRTRI